MAQPALVHLDILAPDSAALGTFSAALVEGTLQVDRLFNPQRREA